MEEIFMKKQLFSILLFLLCMFTLAACSGKKNVTDQEVTLDLAFGKMVGTYTGEMEKGVPNGKGKFTTTNFDQKPWYYEGEFKDGRFSGEGKTVFTESGQTMEGTYENDIWHPNSLQYYEFVQTLKRSFFEIPETAKQTLKDNDIIFPAKDASEVESLVDDTLDYEAIAQSEDYGDKFMYLSDATVKKFYNPFYITENPEKLDDLNCTYIQITDKDGNEYDIYYRGELKDISEGDTISVYGLPIGKGQNKDGGFANYIVLAASFVEPQ